MTSCGRGGATIRTCTAGTSGLTSVSGELGEVSRLGEGMEVRLSGVEGGGVGSRGAGTYSTSRRIWRGSSGSGLRTSWSTRGGGPLGGGRIMRTRGRGGRGGPLRGDASGGRTGANMSGGRRGLRTSGTM